MATSTNGTHCRPAPVSSTSTLTDSSPSPSTTSGCSCGRTPIELLAGEPFDRAGRLAELSGLDATANLGVGAVERVSTGLLCTQVELQPVGRQMLDAADQIAS